jgi:hypothetical protein
MPRLVQIQDGNNRRVAVVEEPRLRLLKDFNSVHALANAAISSGGGLATLIQKHLSDQTLDYDSIYAGNSPWRLMVPLDHPDGPSRTLVTGTGLTHLGSAKDRQAMHIKVQPNAQETMTDSMKMFRWGVEHGCPEPGKIGIAPEWFYKGGGGVLRAANEPLDAPFYAEDGGEEAEIAGLYIIGPDGIPRRIGMTQGNEFSDHKFEKRNYLNLAGSKLRTCSIGPELVTDPNFNSVTGETRIERDGKSIWSKEIHTGEAEMCHSLQNIEHHHFKFENHRRPGDVHVHYYGAHSLSFGDGFELIDGDMMVVEYKGYGRPLRNPIRIAEKTTGGLVAAISLA